MACVLVCCPVVTGHNFQWGDCCSAIVVVNLFLLNLYSLLHHMQPGTSALCSCSMCCAVRNYAEFNLQESKQFYFRSLYRSELGKHFIHTEARRCKLRMHVRAGFLILWRTSSQSSPADFQRLSVLCCRYILDVTCCRTLILHVQRHLSSPLSLYYHGPLMC